VILPDTSAWIEYFRATGSRAHLRLRATIMSRDVVATTEPVMMELLAGARDVAQADALRRALARSTLLPVRDLDTWFDAADLYQSGRRRGVTVRSHVDCLIAAVAIREEVPVLHHDRDFVTLSRFSPLQLVS